MFKVFLSLFHAPVFPTHTLPLSLPFLLLYMCHAELCLDHLQYNVPFLPLGKCCHSRSSLLSPTFSDGHSWHQRRCTLMNGRKGKSCGHTSTTGHIWQEIYRGAQFNIHDLILTLEPTFRLAGHYFLVCFSTATSLPYMAALLWGHKTVLTRLIETVTSHLSFAYLHVHHLHISNSPKKKHFGHLPGNAGITPKVQSARLNSKHIPNIWQHAPQERVYISQLYH